MDPGRKRAIRLTVALTAALLLASALIYTSFSAGRDELTASQLLKRAQPGQSYILAGTVLERLGRATMASSCCSACAIRSSRCRCRSTTRGIVPDPFAPGRGVLVTVREGGSSGAFIGEQNSLTTKCPSKYQAASGSY